LQIPALAESHFEIAPLAGGLTNRNYVLTTKDESYVLRIAGADTELLGIDREREVACLHAAAGAGVGPVVLAHLPEHQTLVTSLIAGKSPTAEEILQPEFMRRMAETLRRCHEYPAPPDLGTFSAFETIRNYTTQAREKNVPLPPELDEALDRLSRIEKELTPSDPDCLCHNDLLIGNIIDDGSALRIIDWEYGGLGDRFFDLGNFAVNAQFNEEQEKALLTYYFGECRPEHLQRLRSMRLVSDLREATWGFLQAGTSKLHPPAYYLDYGRKHLMRFLQGARSLDLKTS
jgi:thiamine kinase-like enzyme